MRRRCLWLIPAFFSAALTAQSAATAPAADPVAALGFSYRLPSDWTLVASKPQSQTATPPAVLPLQPAPKGAACIRVPETARHGDPASVIVVVALPFDCFGQAMTADDLPGFGSGAADGLKQAFDLSAPVESSYSLGNHPFWAERAKGNPKGHNELQYTLEIVCGVLKKSAVCWMAMAADQASLRAFEQMSVSLDSDAATPLVPDAAFDKAPSAP